MENKHTQQVDFSNPNADKITSGTTNKPLENKQTAMQQLLAQLKDERAKLPMLIEWDRCYQAIEMVIQNTYLPIEKKQIMCAYVEGCSDSILDESTDKTRSEDYYNETYGSEGSDAKDVVLGHKTSLDAQMLDRIEPKQETLEEAAERIYPINIVVDYDTNEDIRNIWIEGAKWQQEQILQFLYSEIIERRPYSSSKMCEVVIEFIEQLNTKK